MLTFNLKAEPNTCEQVYWQMLIIVFFDISMSVSAHAKKILCTARLFHVSASWFNVSAHVISKKILIKNEQMLSKLAKEMVQLSWNKAAVR